MSGKGWGIGVIGLLALFLLGPALLIAVASLVSAVSNQFGSRSYDIGSGQQLRVKKTVTPHKDWSTGSKSERTEYALFYKGSDVSSAELQQWLDVKNAGQVVSSTIHDVVELKADDFLVMLDKDSHGISSVVVRIHLDSKTSAVQADVIKLGEEDSQYSWFPHSRLPGWTRAVNVEGAQFLIRSSPFKVIPLGHGELAKVELPSAFLVSDEQGDPQIHFRVVDVDDGKMLGSLSLDKDCFSLPRFSFNHPKLDASATMKDDQEVHYKDGPTWWDKNVEWTAQIATLKLKTDHTLVAPAAKVFSIQHATVEAPAGSLASFKDGDEIDRVPVIAKSCAQKNPNGANKSLSMATSAEEIDVAVFCLQPDWPVDSKIKNKICGAPTRKEVFSSNGVTVNEVTFLYHAMDQKVEPIQIVVPEIEVNGKKFISIKDPETNESQNFKEFFILNESQILFKARGSGPWVLYLANAQEKEFSLKHIGWFSYPGGTFDSIGNDGFLYDAKSGILVRKTPFGYLDRISGLAEIQDRKAVAIFVSNGTIHLRVVQFTANSRMEERAVSTLEVPGSCFGEDELLPDEMTTAERQRWFNKHFVWSSDKSKVSVKVPCR